jgi:hypothetical protein
MEWAALCNQERLGFLEQPASAITSAAFVVAAAGILAGRPRESGTPAREQRTVFALLVAGIGVGSFLQHGPHPPWQAYAHDLPLAAALVFVAADAASDLTGHELSPGWWLVRRRRWFRSWPSDRRRRLPPRRQSRQPPSR